MKCYLCPRKCGVDREVSAGFCGVGNDIIVGNVGIHKWEEPIIGGSGGSGAVFFCGCNLRCVYCQNFEISHGEFSRFFCGAESSETFSSGHAFRTEPSGMRISLKPVGYKVSSEEIAEKLVEMQLNGAECADFVTPTHYSDKITEIVSEARKRGLTVPVVYNCGGYEDCETLKKLEDFVDVYLPDFKYADGELSRRLSGARDYPEVALKAITEMKRQKKDVIGNGKMKSGVLIRHLVLPSLLNNSRKVLDLIKENFGTETYVSLMSQYFPPEIPIGEVCLNRKLTRLEKNRIEDYFFSLGFNNGFVQELCSADKKYVPVWDVERKLRRKDNEMPVL